ncbi:MAG: pilus assembly protein [Desulfobacterales bacterium]|jgi:Flp pilus assembly protein TadG
MKTKRIIKDQKGGALVEFAIVLPLLLLLVVGIVEFGLLVYNKHIITNGSREGTRAAIVAGIDYLDNQEIKTIVKNYCNPRLIDFNGNTVTDANIDLDPADRTTIGFGQDFKVTIEYDYGFLIPSLFNIGSTTKIIAKTLMKMEQAIGS